MSRTRYVHPSSALEDLLCFDLYAASRAMTRRYRPLLADLGLTYPQYLVVVALGATGPASIKELAGTLRLDHATLTPLLQRMESAGLLTRERDPADRRSVQLALTEQGQAAYRASEDVQCTMSEDFGLTAEQQRELQLTLRKVTASIERALAASE